jgi:hypothetical protein
MDFARRGNIFILYRRQLQEILKVFNHSLAIAQIEIGNSKPKVSNRTGWVV